MGKSELLIKLLNPLGFELKEASNGREAVEVWESWQPDLIWMDMGMPMMNGYEASQEIKSSTKGQATAIIALTASLEEEKAVVLSAGCDDFMRKPFRESEIFEMMEKRLRVGYIYEDSATVEQPEFDLSRVLSPVYFQEKLSGELMASLEGAILSLDREVRELQFNKIPAVGLRFTPPNLQECYYKNATKRAILSLDREVMAYVVEEIRKLDDALAKAISRLLDNLEYDFILNLIAEIKEAEN